MKQELNTACYIHNLQRQHNIYICAMIVLITSRKCLEVSSEQPGI